MNVLSFFRRLTITDRIALAGVLVAVLVPLLIEMWPSEQSFEAAKQRLDKTWRDYHDVLNSAFNKDTSPDQYFTRFWQVQNDQVNLWQEEIISDNEMMGYLNDRIKELKGDIPMPNFAYLDDNPKARCEGYKDRQKAWETAAASYYRGKKLGEVMNEVRRKENNEVFTKSDVAKLRERVRKFPL